MNARQDYYIHFNGAAVFVKEGSFFEQQGGLISEWGRAWIKVQATSIEHARTLHPAVPS